MITMKDTLEKLNLNINLPEVQYDYPVLAYYESYEFKTIDGQKCVELKGRGYKGIPLVCIINLYEKNIKEYYVYSDGDCSLISSMDKEGYMPFY